MLDSFHPVLLDQELSIPSDLRFSSTRIGIENIPVYSGWLARKFHGSMEYLTKDDRIRKIIDPSLLMRDAKSIVVFVMNYRKSKPAREGYGRIASYAGFADYHDFYPDIIDSFVTNNGLFKDHYRTYVDTGPLSERGLSIRSSLGWIGKNSMLINPSLGSFTFIGAAVTDIPLDSPSSPPPDLCGICTRCIDSCPTGAIKQDRTIDSRLCISFQTIENRGIIPKRVADRMEDMVFGCDICNEVCPWNREKKESTIPEVRKDLFSNRMKLEDIAFIDRATFDQAYRGSAIKRATYEGFARNALVALHNANREDLVREASKQFTDLRRDQAHILFNEKDREL
jgi:epoxyqueuosine reductase